MMPEQKSYGSVWEPEHRQIKKLNEYLVEFTDLARASFAILIRENGDVLCTDSDFPRKDNVMIAALASAGYSASQELSQSVEFSDSTEQNDCKQFILEGEESNIFVSRIVEDILLVSVFSTETTIGSMLVHSAAFCKTVTDFTETARLNAVEGKNRDAFQFDEDFSLQVNTQLDNLFLDKNDS